MSRTNLSLVALLAISLVPFVSGKIPAVKIGVDSTGKDVMLPMVGLGTWQYNDTLAGSSVATALSIDYVHIDTALGYDNQVGIGKALKASGRERNSYFITSKIPGGLNSTIADQNVNQCLNDLQLDYIDLMLIHYPASWSGVGGKKSRQEEWRALESFYKSGKVRAIGVSHYCKKHLEDILEIATVPPAVNQVQYHVGMGAPSTSGNNATDWKNWMSTKLTYQSFSPLCGPCGTTELIDGDLVTSIGKKYNKSGAQVSLKWQVQQGIPVIPKTHKKDYMLQNIDMFSWKLSDEDMAALTAATSPPVAGNPGPPATSGDCDVL